MAAPSLLFRLQLGEPFGNPVELIFQIPRFFLKILQLTWSRNRRKCLGCKGGNSGLFDSSSHSEMSLDRGSLSGSGEFPPFIFFQKVPGDSDKSANDADSCPSPSACPGSSTAGSCSVTSWHSDFLSFQEIVSCELSCGSCRWLLPVYFFVSSFASRSVILSS